MTSQTEHNQPKNWHIVVDFAPSQAEASETKGETTSKSEPVEEIVPTPNEIFELAKKTILYQDEALKALSAVLYYHLKAKVCYEHQRVAQFGANYEKYDLLANVGQPLPMPAVADTSQAPIFITGKTGGGKTHLVKELCRLTNINHLVINATHLSNSGYKGMTLADVGEMLMNGVQQDVQKAMFSVIFLDEFDKLFLANDTQLGMYHRALATELLTIIEGTTDFPVKDNDSISSRHMLFILGGSFNLHQSKHAQMGFVHDEHQSIPNSQLGLTKMGLPDELAGRIGSIIELSPLTNEMMIEIIKHSPTSPLVRLNNRLAMVQCTLHVDDKVLQRLIDDRQDAIEQFGVRGLYQGFNELPQVLEILIEAPSYPNHHYMMGVSGFSRSVIDST